MSAIAQFVHPSSERHITPNHVFDAERDSPHVVAALEISCPGIREILSRLREKLPLAPDCAPRLDGSIMRLPSHYRSVCVALEDSGPDLPLYSSVIVFKGTEPLLEDFSSYLEWMLAAEFGTRELPVGLHFPLALRMCPGSVPIDECRREQRVTTAVHTAHLQRFGSLAHAPVPLFVHEMPDKDRARYIEHIERVLPSQAFERIEGRARAGIGIEVLYYPALPIRVRDLHSQALAARVLPRIAPEVVESTIVSWAKVFARLLHIGYIPYAPWNQGWGACVDPGNACIDGGVCDLLTLVRREWIENPRVVRQCVLSSVEFFAKTVATFCEVTLGLGSDPVTTALVLLRVRTQLLEQVRKAAAPDMEVDPAILSCFEVPSVTELSRLPKYVPQPAASYRATPSGVAASV